MANYVNNPEFLRALILYKEACEAAEAKDEQIPRIPKYLGECFFHIANRLAFRPNFIGYTYRDDMVADGLEVATLRIRKFNPDVSSNPFAYFTQIIWNAFLQRIAKEKKQTYIRFKTLENAVLTGTVTSKSAHSGASGADFVDLDAEYISTFVEKYENTMGLGGKKKAKEEESLDKFVETEE